MTATDLPLRSSEETVQEKARPNTLARIARYMMVRATVMALTVVVAVWVIIFIASMGGFVDEIIRSRIDQAIMGMVMGGWLKDVPTEEKFEIIEETISGTCYGGSVR